MFEILGFVSKRCSICCYKCGDNVCGAPDDRKKDCDTYTKLQAADAIWELSRMVDASIPKSDVEIIISEVAKAQPKWIPVTERLPGNESVLIYSEGWGVAEGKYHPETGEWRQYRWNAVRKPITHWMPLPEPPREETE